MTGLDNMVSCSSSEVERAFVSPGRARDRKRPPRAHAYRHAQPSACRRNRADRRAHRSTALLPAPSPASNRFHSSRAAAVFRSLPSSSKEPAWSRPGRPWLRSPALETGTRLCGPAMATEDWICASLGRCYVASFPQLDGCSSDQDASYVRDIRRARHGADNHPSHGANPDLSLGQRYAGHVAGTVHEKRPVCDGRTRPFGERGNRDRRGWRWPGCCRPGELCIAGSANLDPCRGIELGQRHGRKVPQWRSLHCHGPARLSRTTGLRRRPTGFGRR